MPAETYLGANYGAAAFDAIEDKAFDESKTLISATECNLYGYDIINLDAAVEYIHFFNVAATASVTVGTTVPDLVVPIAASQHLVLLSEIPLMHFTLGCVAIQKTVNTTAGTTGPTADGHAVFYKK